MPGIPSHSDGRSMTRILTLGLAFLCSLTLLSCGLANGPEKAAKTWFEATERGEVLEADELVCEEQKESFREGAFVLSGIYTFAEEFLGTDQPLEIDASDIEYTRMDGLSSGDRAVVAVEGELRMAAAGVIKSENISYLWAMVKEDGQWKWCGSTTALGELETPEESITDETPAPTLTSEPEVIDPGTVEATADTFEDVTQTEQSLDRFALILNSPESSRSTLLIIEPGIEGSEKVLFEQQAYDAGDLAWSPETEKILFTMFKDIPPGVTSYKQAYNALYGMGLNDSEPLELTLPGQDAFDPNWIDGGERVRYTTWIQKGEGASEITRGVVFVNADGSNRQVIELPDFAGARAEWFWSADGEIAYVIDVVDGSLQLYSADKDGSSPVELASLSLDAYSGSDYFDYRVSPDRSQIFFHVREFLSGNPKFTTLVWDIASGSLTEIESTSGEALIPLGWSPDRTQLIVQIVEYEGYDATTDQLEITFAGIYFVNPLTGQRTNLKGQYSGEPIEPDLNGIEQPSSECSLSSDATRILTNVCPSGLNCPWIFDMTTQNATPTSEIFPPGTIPDALENLETIGDICWLSK